MDELFKTSPEIIRAAATNPLALAALVVLTLGVLAFVHFRHSSELTRISIFVLTGLALLVLFALVLVGMVVDREFEDARQADNATTTQPVANTPSLPAQEQPIPQPVQPSLPVSTQMAANCVAGTLTCPLVLPAQLPKGTNCICYTLSGEVFEGTAY